MSLALFIVKVLRKLPHTAQFDQHLTNCAAHEVVYRAFDDSLPQLRLRHVLAQSPLPDPRPPLDEPISERVNASILPFDKYRRRTYPVII